MPRDPKDISLNATQRTHRRLGELDDQKEPIRLRVGSGPAGAEGKEGRWPAVHYKWLTNTEETNPGSGKIKRNAAATKLNVHEIDADGRLVSAWLATFDDSTTTGARGTITIRQIGSPTRFVMFTVTGALTDNGEWDTIVVSKIVEGEAIENEKEVTVEFARTGDKGEKGETGEKGEAGLNGAPGPSGTGAPMACRLATAAALPAYTRTTNKLEANANGALGTIDGVTAAVNDLILLKDGAAGADNGVYKVIKVGSGTEKWVMERYESMDTSAEAVPGMLITVDAGTKNHDEVYQLTTDAPITLNTTALTFKRTAPRDFGLVEALPTSEAIKGDKCQYIADKTNGVIWNLVYDGEGEFPWKKIGGPTLVARSDVARTRNNEAYGALPTDPLSIVVPLKGDYDIRIEAELYNMASGRNPILSYAVGATAANDNWAIDFYDTSAAFGAASCSLTTRHTGIAAAAKIEEQAKTPGGEARFNRRRLTVDPVRVG